MEKAIFNDLEYFHYFDFVKKKHTLTRLFGTNVDLTGWGGVIVAFYNKCIATHAYFTCKLSLCIQK